MIAVPTKAPAPESVPAAGDTSRRREGPKSRKRPKSRSGRSRSNRVAYLYLALPVGFYAVFMIYPWLHTLYISFFDWDGIGIGSWAGTSNYTEILHDPTLRSAIVHAFILLIFFSALPIVLALGLTALMTGSRKRTYPISRTVLFLPQILPAVAVGVAWRWIFGEQGLLNQVLNAVGLGDLARTWLGDFTWAFPAVGLVGTWVGTGLCVVFFLAGAQKVPEELYEAAQLDGAGRGQEFRSITLPHLRREIGVAATVTTVAALASFDIVYVMTSGGPGTSTMVPGVLIYQLAFTAGKVGQACALAIVLSLIVFAAIAVINRISGERE
jgi:raffinose/stachyose/melibiose transport system permease protein